MTATLHKLTAGDGYTYLTRQVAVQDGRVKGSLVDYYAKGEVPGRWFGSGLVGLGSVSVGDEVTEAQMKALFGEGLHPDADQIVAGLIGEGVGVKQALRAAVLGQRFSRFGGGESEFVRLLAVRYREWNEGRGVVWNAPIPGDVRAGIRSVVGRETFEKKFGRGPLDERELAGHIARESRPATKAVAGFDLTFSPVKSVSTLWAVADRDVSQRIEEAHAAAVADTLRWVEREVAYTRRGRNGVRQVDVTGLVAGLFVHRDSRAGDPDLHTHVAISNKVQAVEDGAWLALDGAVLYRAGVAASERYNSVLEAELERRLGVRFEAREAETDRRVVREIVGVDAGLMRAWSSRRAVIERRKAELGAQFQVAHGRPPTPREAIELAQQANLETREDKHEARSLGEQREMWRVQAAAVLGGEAQIGGMVAGVLAPVLGSAKRVGDVDVDQVAAVVVGRLQMSRARFADTHVIAEAQRQVRALGVVPGDRQGLVETVTARVLGHALPLIRGDEMVEPTVLRRADGVSVYERAHSRLYTTVEVLAAEGRLVGAARDRSGRVVRSSDVAVALLEAEANGLSLNAGQVDMVEQIATSGARVQLVLAPAGSGKTTAMGVFTRLWEGCGGRVIGLAPSAVSAVELGAATGATSDTIAALTTRLAAGLKLPGWAETVNEKTMIVIDEAGMAGTVDLDAVVRFAAERGASVRLVGDDRQLAAVAAGGVLRDIATEVGAVALTELMRFEDPAEGVATLAVREGDHSAIGFYFDRGRVHVRDQDGVLDAVFDAWERDKMAGRDSLMLASTRQSVNELNVRARTARLLVAEGSVGAVVKLRDGMEASAGDLIVTRVNDRQTRITATDWVKNGDRWIVEQAFSDGSVKARHVGTGRVVTLSPQYVSESVDLGYATTVHGAQGQTVDTTHTALTGQESRQLLYVATSRGRASNDVYLSISGDGDEHSVLKPEHVAPMSATDVLETILDRDGAQRSARTEMREFNDATAVLERASAIYSDALLVGAEKLMGEEALAELTAQCETKVPGVTDAAAWEALRGRLALIAANGHDPVAVLVGAAGRRELDSADDVAAVLHWRVGIPTGRGPLPWLHAVPSKLVEDPLWGPYLQARAEQVIAAAAEVGTRYATMGENELPVWAHQIAQDRELVAEVAVWRIASRIPDSDLQTVGVNAKTVDERNYQRRLQQKVGGTVTHGQQWVATLREHAPEVLRDPWWPVLGARLDAAHRAGVDVDGLLDSVFTRSLPDDHPAGALWYRLAATVAPVITEAAVNTRLRPAWSDELVAALPAGVGTRVMRDEQWPTLVAAVDDARDQGVDVGSVLSTAAALVGVNRASKGCDVSEVTIRLAWKVTDLVTNSAAAAEDDQPPEDPADFYDPEIVAFLADQARRSEKQHDPVPVFTDPLPDPVRLVGTFASVESTTSRDRIVELHEQAAVFYRAAYIGSPAAGYVAHRFAGDELLNDEWITVGYAPPGWTTLTDHLLASGATRDELVDAGLSRLSSKGTPIDVFRDRVVFGIRDSSGDLVGFSGRAAPGADPAVPKYVNTATTAAFHKGTVLFGLAENRGLIDAGATPVRVEGVMDAIAITKAGNGLAVGLAPLGTALTTAQAEMIAAAARRPGQPPIVLEATDTDLAGQKAATKDFWKLVLAGADPRRLVLVDFEDPGNKVKDPAEAYQRDQGASLNRVLSMPDMAPALADQLTAARVAADRKRLADGEVVPIVAAARDMGRIIAALPAEQWDDSIRAASAALTGTTGIDNQDLVAQETIRAAVAWDPTDTAQETTAQRLAALQSGLNRITSLDSPARIAADETQYEIRERLQQLQERLKPATSKPVPAPAPQPNIDREYPHMGPER